MATEITKWQAVEVPSPTPQHAKSLSPQELIEHRTRIAFEVRTVLSAYFQPHEAEEIKAAQLAWWCDELQDWTKEQVLWALRHWNREEPDRRPTPGHILRICKAARGARLARQMKREEAAPAPQERVTKEQAAAILEEANYAPKRMDGG